MPAPKIEILARKHHPLGMPPARFLRDYWQKRPLLIRQAFPGFQSPITPNDLAGAACEPESLARLVVHRARGDRWQVRNGPFDGATFTKLPKSNWTLLVQDCDKWFAPVGALLQHFAFLPSWRLDDIMVSYATDGGSVGAHVDRYDVFLLQARGRRRWLIDDQAKPDAEFRAGVELKLLREFHPSHDWVLEPGDMLYLPPGIAHHGIADGECLTFSIGLRAPAAAELLVDFSEHVGERLGESWRYADPDLRPAAEPGAIDAATLRRVARLLREAAVADQSVLSDWFARFITRYRSAVAAAPRRRKLDRADLERRIRGGAQLWRSPWSRAAFVGAAAKVELFVAGERYPSSRRLARLLTERESVAASDLRGASAADWTSLTAIVNAGHWVIGHE